MGLPEQSELNNSRSVMSGAEVGAGIASASRDGWNRCVNRSLTQGRRCKCLRSIWAFSLEEKARERESHRGLAFCANAEEESGTSFITSNRSHKTNSVDNFMPSADLSRTSSEQLEV